MNNTTATNTLTTYQLAFTDGENGGFDIVESFEALDDTTANKWAEMNESYMQEKYNNTDWYILRDGENING